MGRTRVLHAEKATGGLKQALFGCWQRQVAGFLCQYLRHRILETRPALPPRDASVLYYTHHNTHTHTQQQQQQQQQHAHTPCALPERRVSFACARTRTTKRECPERDLSQRKHTTHQGKGSMEAGRRAHEPLHIKARAQTMTGTLASLSLQPPALVQLGS